MFDCLNGLTPGIRRIAVASIATLIAACSSTRAGSPGGATYPLNACGRVGQKHCVSNLFENNEAVKRRGKSDFPPYYLELWDGAKVAQFCSTRAATSSESPHACEDRIANLWSYLDESVYQSPAPVPPPRTERPGPDEWAVALEGGGSKAAPFALGVLGGFSELQLLHDHDAGHTPRISAIASISGGSYAASYYYNRLLDKHLRKDNAGEEADWFRSCIPDHIAAKHFKLFPGDSLPKCAEDGDRARNCQYEFAGPYRFLGHVWVNHDLLRGDAPGNLNTQEDFRLSEYANIGLLTSETAVTLPFQFVARTVFRWPMNSAPSKLAYKLGLEREYGYSPDDWKQHCSQWTHMFETLYSRRVDRTVSKLSELTLACDSTDAIQPPTPPKWIIGTTAPGRITGVEWALPAERDPIRQQFEITATGYGSGVYGYAHQPPDAPHDFLGTNPTGLPILDSVVASAAFFDDDQTQISYPALRLPLGILQHFGNVTWFTEIPNFNVGDKRRTIKDVSPWPAYLLDTKRDQQTAHIHLQDGGNAENSGIFPLLRRGYQKIFYAHGTQDTDAEFASICHLKNQLELDGSYVLVSPDLEAKIDSRNVGKRGRFKTYLDGLCATQLDGSDLAAFDLNSYQADGPKNRAVAKLYCARLGYRLGDGDPACEEFIDKFLRFEPGATRGDSAGRSTCSWHAPRPASESNPAGLPSGRQEGGFVPDKELFYHWQSGTVVRFQVFRFDPLNCDPAPDPSDSEKLVSTIVALVPGISLDEIKCQLQDGDKFGDWKDVCRAAKAKPDTQIKFCPGPGNVLVQAPAGTVAADAGAGRPGLSCLALAQVLEDQCGDTFARSHPDFPQDNFVAKTIHATYTGYGAYYDLGRHLVWRAVYCETHRDECDKILKVPDTR